MWWDENLRTELGLDFDADGHLIGIELFSMSHVLRPEIFDLARPIDRDGDHQTPSSSAGPLIGTVAREQRGESVCACQCHLRRYALYRQCVERVCAEHGS
jgi:hypothetical protein